jgi:hypothetical protein
MKTDVYNTQEITDQAGCVRARISECLGHAVRILCNEQEPQVVRDVVQGYLYSLCRNRAGFLKAAFRHLSHQDVELPTAGRFSLSELIVHPPARWEFEHVDVIGIISDAVSCAGRYRTCSRFLAVHPLELSDPLICEREPQRIPIRHKPSSPWFQRFVRRQQLKLELGSQYRALVGYARTMTKGEFLEQFVARPGTSIPMIDRKGRPYTVTRGIPDISTYKLLNRTGYTPEEFWREVRRPNTVAPHKPQLELL